MSSKRVELHPAFKWTCDECGRTNFTSAVVAELSPEERKEMLEAGMTPTTGDWLIAPAEVECQKCGTTFETKESGDNDD